MTRMKYYALRTLQTVFLFWLVFTLLFLMFRLMPGSYIDMMAVSGSSAESIAQVKEKWGLNEPLYVQYWNYLVNFLTFDIGLSLQYKQPVWDFVKMRMFNSLILIGPAITLAYILGAVLGTGLGSTKGSKYEQYGIIPIIIAGTFPSFFVGVVLIVVFSSWLGWFPSSGILGHETRRLVSDREVWWMYLNTSFILHYTLPFTAIVLRYLYLPTLIMRTSVIEVKDQDFNYYNRITGLSKFTQLRHLAKHASLPIITLYPVSLTRALGGLVLIETVFNWPGIGYSLVGAVLARDYPVVQFVFFLIAVFIITANFVVDIVYGTIDPRVSTSE